MATEILPIGNTAVTSASVDITDAAGETFVVIGAPFFSSAAITVDFEFPAASNKWHEFAVLVAPGTRVLNIPGPMKVRFRRRDSRQEPGIQAGLVQL